MYYDDSYQNQARISLYSLVLLVIFVSAAALILAAIIWRPWADDDESITSPAPFGPPVPEAAAPAPGAEVVSGP